MRRGNSAGEKGRYSRYDREGVSLEDVLGLPFPRAVTGEIEDWIAARDRELAGLEAQGPTYAPTVPIRHTPPTLMPGLDDRGTIAVLGDMPAAAPGGGGGYMGAPGVGAASDGPLGGGGGMQRPGMEPPGVSPVDIARGLKSVYSGANKIFDLGLPDIPSPFQMGWDWLKGQFGGGDAAGVGGIGEFPSSPSGPGGIGEFPSSPSGPGGIGEFPIAAGEAIVPGAGYAASALPAGYESMLLGEAGRTAASIAPGGPGGFMGAGFGATAGILAPAALVMGAGAIERMKPPSVGPNYSIRFRKGPDGLRTETGSDNDADPHALQITEAWARDVLGRALGDNVTQNLDGALTYFAGGDKAGMHSGWGYASGGEQKPFATAAGALKAMIAANHNQGRITGDLSDLLRGVDAAIEQGGSLEDQLAALRERRLDIADTDARQRAADGVASHYIDPRRMARLNSFLGGP